MLFKENVINIFKNNKLRFLRKLLIKHQNLLPALKKKIKNINLKNFKFQIKKLNILKIILKIFEELHLHLDFSV